MLYLYIILLTQVFNHFRWKEFSGRADAVRLQKSTVGLQPTAKGLWTHTRCAGKLDFCSGLHKNFELGIMRFGLSILQNKPLLIGFLVGCGNMVLAIGTTLQDVFTMNLADVKLAIVLQFADKPRYWG